MSQVLQPVSAKEIVDNSNCYAEQSRELTLDEAEKLAEDHILNVRKTLK